MQNISSFLACLITSFDQSFILPDLFQPHWFPNASRFKRLWFLEILVSIISPPSKLAIWYAIFCEFDWCKPIKGTILEHLLSITITPGSWSFEVKKEFIMRIDAAIEPIKIIKSISGHLSIKISLGFCTWISSFSFPSSFEEPAIYMSLTNLVFLSLFKISFEIIR